MAPVSEDGALGAVEKPPDDAVSRWPVDVCALLMPSPPEGFDIIPPPPRGLDVDTSVRVGPLGSDETSSSERGEEWSLWSGSWWCEAVLSRPVLS